jgi:HflK protein
MSHDHHHDPQPSPPTPGPRASEDAGARALSEALRSSFNIVKILVAVLVVAFLASGVFTVEPNEVAVKLRFGKPVGVGDKQLLQPGLHWKLPYPIDEIVRVPVGKTHEIRSTAGWYAMTPEEELAGGRDIALAVSYLQPGVDGYTLTGDGNVIHVRAVLSYRIADPVAYAFRFENVTNVLQHVLDNALFNVSARFGADDALYRSRAAFQEAVVRRVNQAIDRHGLGVAISPRGIRIEPPLYVQRAFSEVVDAQQQGDTKIREAEGQARSVTNQAIGQASVIVQDGINRSNLMVQTIKVDATNFLGFLPSYQRDPELFRQRLLAEATERVLTNATFKAFLPQRSDGRPRELRLLLSPEVEPPKKIPANTPN